MTRIRAISLIAIAFVGLTACSSEGFDRDSDEGIILITHTTKGTLYWQ